MKIENLLPIEDRQKWIKLEDCKDGWLYLVHARNSHLGIFVQAKNGFVISRYKFDKNFLFTEFHWDIGEPHGTVKPIKEIEKAPTFASEEEKLEYLNKRGQEIVFNPWDKTTDERPGRLISREHGTMSTARTRDMKAYRRVYREANREKILARQRAYYRANRKKILACARAYYWANVENERARKRVNRSEKPANVRR